MIWWVWCDGDNDLMISVVFSPNPIITTPILCKYLDRERDGAIWLEGPPTCFMMIAMMMIELQNYYRNACSNKIAAMFHTAANTNTVFCSLIGCIHDFDIFIMWMKMNNDEFGELGGWVVSNQQLSYQELMTRLHEVFIRRICCPLACG